MLKLLKEYKASKQVLEVSYEKLKMNKTFQGHQARAYKS